MKTTKKQHDPAASPATASNPANQATQEDAPKDSQKQCATCAAGRPYVLPRSLVEIAEDPKAHNRDRVCPVRELLDRGWCKAPAVAAMQTDDPLELSDIAREIQTIADELAARREAKP